VFIAVFSVFIAATLVLVVLTMRWAVRRDRDRRTAQSSEEKTP
jgi:Flp pilus assembly protein TadB